jgi:hypothetical protein
MTRQEAHDLFSLPPNCTESEVLAAAARLEAELPMAPTPEQQRVLDEQRARIAAAKSLLLGTLPVLHSRTEPTASAALAVSATQTPSVARATGERLPANTPLAESPTFATWLKSPFVIGIVVLAVVALVLLFMRQQRIQRENDRAAAEGQLEELRDQQRALEQQLEDERAAREREQLDAVKAPKQE